MSFGGANDKKSTPSCPLYLQSFFKGHGEQLYFLSQIFNADFEARQLSSVVEHRIFKNTGLTLEVLLACLLCKQDRCNQLSAVVRS